MHKRYWLEKWKQDKCLPRQDDCKGYCITCPYDFNNDIINREEYPI